jgi:hypothetical protein
MSEQFQTADTDSALDVELILDTDTPSDMLLSIGYGNAHVVVQVEQGAITNILRFIAANRAERGSRWVEVGHFGSHSVTLTLAPDIIAVVVDTDLRVGGFGQSAGLYVPRILLDDFVGALDRERRKLDRT